MIFARDDRKTLPATESNATNMLSPTLLAALSELSSEELDLLEDDLNFFAFTRLPSSRITQMLRYLEGDRDNCACDEKQHLLSAA